MSGHSTSLQDVAASLPPRSRLYRLQPVGAGSGDVESIGGYVARLAEAHRVTTDALLCRLLVWLARGTPEFIGRHREWRTFGNGRVLDLDAGGALTRALQDATLIPDLEGLTLAPLRRVVCDRGLVASIRAWCPACYADSRHERLAWCIAPVTACAVHGTMLTRACPRCGRSGAPYAGTVRVACCAWCSHDLARDDLGPEADADALARARSVADFLASSPQLDAVLSPTLVTTRFRAACARAGLTMTGACERFGIPRATASGWWRGAVTPSLDKALAIAGLFGVRLGAFLAGEGGEIEPDRTVPRAPRRRRRIRWGPIGHLLAGHQDPAESVVALASRLGVDRAEMRRHFPAECAAISARADAFTAAKARARLEGETRRMCNEIDRLVATGAAPGLHLVAGARNAGALREPALRARVVAHIHEMKGKPWASISSAAIFAPSAPPRASWPSRSAPSGR